MGQRQERNQQKQGSPGSASGQHMDRSSSRQQQARGQANQGQQNQGSEKEKQAGQNNASDDRLDDMDEDEPASSGQQASQRSGSKNLKR
jgi:hypothetical protein